LKHEHQNKGSKHRKLQSLWINNILHKLHFADKSKLSLKKSFFLLSSHLHVLYPLAIWCLGDPLFPGVAAAAVIGPFPQQRA
jgi:hypothetical protein